MREQRLVGIVSEGDLLHRVEAGTERHRSWWLEGFIGNDKLATEYVTAHGRKVSDVMTSKVITASPQAPLHEIAALMEKNAIKRMPVLENGQLVGIVSRANLIQVVATARKLLDIPLSDTTIREKILSHLKKQPWAHTMMLNVTVNAGIVDLWGIAESAAPAEGHQGCRRIHRGSIRGKRRSDHPVRGRMAASRRLHRPLATSDLPHEAADARQLRK